MIPMSELGERYKKATEMVFHDYETVKDNRGLSQRWKIAAIEEDRKSGNDSSILIAFVKDVESKVNALESMKPQPKFVLAKHEIFNHWADKIKPSIPPDTSVHGIDLNWN
jgi:hypothetical protein